MTRGAPTARARPATPELVGGRFHLERELGRGGMAAVFAARDMKTGERAAVKRITGPVDAELRERFAREARAVGALAHPGICRVLASGEERGAPWLAMELVDGPALGAVSTRAPLPASVAAEVLRQLLEALAAAHAGGVVHRDLKPNNVMVGADGALKIVDFGIAKAIGDDDLTATGALLGTPAFMSPEQARSEPVDARSDLFSCGLTVAALLRGNRHRFASIALEPAQLLLRTALEPPAPLFEESLDVPVALDAVLGTLTSLNPDARFATAAQALAALHASGLLVEDGAQLLKLFVASPERVRATENARTARAELLHARALESVSGGERAAFLAASRAASLDPTLGDAVVLRDRVARAHGLDSSGAALRDPRIKALDEELTADPNNVALLVQKARIFGEHHDVRHEAAALWRALRVRPDPVVVERVRTILVGPPSPRTNGVRALLGPRSPASASAHDARTPLDARARVVHTPARDVGRTSLITRGALAALVLGAAAFTVATVRGVVAAGEVKMPSTSVGGTQEQAAIQRTLRGAQHALVAGDLAGAQQLATEVLDKRVSIESGREALLVRARARQRLGEAGLALRDLDEIERMATSADDPRAAEVALLRSQLATNPSGQRVGLE